jgi:hypothetical protein
MMVAARAMTSPAPLPTVAVMQFGKGDLAMVLSAPIGSRAGAERRCYLIIEATLQTNS